MPAQNLVEYAKGLEPGVQKAFVEMFAQTSDILAALPLQAAPGGSYRYDREAALPGVAFRGINESYTQTTGVINPLVEQTFIAGGEIKVDKALIRRFGSGRRAREEKMQVKSLTRAITNTIINGANASNSKEFDGIKTRLTGSAVTANSAASGGAALSLYNLDRAIDKVMEPTHIIMSKAMRTRLTQAGRNTGVGGYVAQTKNDFGNTITTYRDLPILVGYEDEVNDTNLFPFNEVASGGGSAVTTSIYIASMKEGMFTGLQVEPMDVKDLGELDASPHYATRIEWDFGICIEHPSALHRLTSITDAAIVA
ncbi:MAG: major capsid protein [Brevundimonas sp.]|uniref:major capsid protein n=1 Tax=Brevundimonas sp. TaxID=1871086 RepID=UPI00391A8DC0